MEIPEGWKLVPIEPTKEMIIDGIWSLDGQILSNASFIYKAMISAAPPPPGKDG